MVANLNTMRNRIDYTSEKLSRIQHDQGHWNTEPQRSSAVWLLNDLVDQLIRLEATITDLDTEIHQTAASLETSHAADLVAQSRLLFESWLNVALAVHAQLQFAQQMCHPILQADVFAALIQQVQDCLLPDEEFFDDDSLAKLRDRAIADADAGHTREFFDARRDPQP